MKPRKWLAIFRLGLAEAIAYRTALFVWILASCFPLVALALWAGMAAKSPVGDYTQADFVGYFVTAFLVRQLTSSWVVWDLDRQIRTGELSTLMLRPVHPLVHHLVANIAALPVRLLLALPLGLAVLLFVGAGTLDTSLVTLTMIVPALVGGWLIVFISQVIIGCLAFWVTSATGIYDFWLGFFVVLSGYVVPISLMPEGVVAVVDLLPFHASFGFIVELATGKLATGEAWRGLGVQWVWVGLHALMARLCWRRGLRVYGAVGA